MSFGAGLELNKLYPEKICENLQQILNTSHFF